MARVIIIGAGVAGLCAAIQSSIAGHHVVVLDRAKRIGGRATSQNRDGFSLHYGPHLIDKKGPLFKLSRKLSRIRPSTKSLRIDKIDVVGLGSIRPIGNIKQTIENKRALKSMDYTNPYFLAGKFIASWGGEFNQLRWSSFCKNKLCVSTEGWVGIIGRLASALDEIGVLIETNCEVTSIEDKQVILADGRKVECDAIIIACGVTTARNILSTVDSELTKQTFKPLQRSTASIIELGLRSKPLDGRQAIVEASNQMALLDYVAIHPRLNSNGAHISAIAVGGLKSDLGETRYSSSGHRMEKLRQFLDSHIAGWKKYIVTDLQQESIILSYSNTIDSMAFEHHGIIMAGPWVASKYILADAAAATGKSAANNLKNLACIKQLIQ